jgi:hypothetical protein
MMDVMSYAAFAISVEALLFTVLSFSWQHARPGRLRTYEPTTWQHMVMRRHGCGSAMHGMAR